MKIPPPKIKERVFFYGTLTLVLTMFGFLYVQYKDQDQIIRDLNAKSNRQLQLAGQFYQEDLERQLKSQFDYLNNEIGVLMNAVETQHAELVRLRNK